MDDDITISEAAWLLGTTRRRVLMYIYDGRLVGRRTRQSVYVSRVQVLALQAALSEPSSRGAAEREKKTGDGAS